MQGGGDRGRIHGAHVCCHRGWREGDVLAFASACQVPAALVCPLHYVSRGELWTDEPAYQDTHCQ